MIKKISLLALAFFLVGCSVATPPYCAHLITTQGAIMGPAGPMMRMETRCLRIDREAEPPPELKTQEDKPQGGAF